MKRTKTTDKSLVSEVSWNIVKNVKLIKGNVGINGRELSSDDA
jgi:hypothetical protein